MKRNKRRKVNEDYKATISEDCMDLHTNAHLSKMQAIPAVLHVRLCKTWDYYNILLVN